MRNGFGLWQLGAVVLISTVALFIIGRGLDHGDGADDGERAETPVDRLLITRLRAAQRAGGETVSAPGLSGLESGADARGGTGRGRDSAAQRAAGEGELEVDSGGGR